MSKTKPRTYPQILRAMAEDVRSEANVSDRPGSYARLVEIAEAMEMLADRWPSDG